MTMCTCTKGLPPLEVALYINKSQGMALLAGANTTGLNHTLQQLVTLYKLGNPRESTQNREF